MAGHLDLGPFAQEWTCAVALSFVNRAWFRVGSEQYARQGRTYGVTTLYKRHASVRGTRVTFCFRAKHRTLVRTTIADEELANAVRALLQYPGGSRLFRFERDGEQANLTGPILNAYVAEFLSPGFTAKDFRTWGGTLAAATALAAHGPPQSPTEERRVLAAVMRSVGAELGNTAAVARSSYVSPAVVEQWRDGRTLAQFREPATSRRLGALSRAGARRAGTARPAPLLAHQARPRGGGWSFDAPRVWHIDGILSRVHILDRSRSRLPKPLRTLVDWALTITLAVIAVLAFQAEVAKPYHIPSPSMEPTLHCAKPVSGCLSRVADRVIANRLVYRFHEPRRGDIVVFKAPARVEAPAALVAPSSNGLSDYPARSCRCGTDSS